MAKPQNGWTTLFGRDRTVADLPPGEYKGPPCTTIYSRAAGIDRRAEFNIPIQAAPPPTAKPFPRGFVLHPTDPISDLVSRAPALQTETSIGAAAQSAARAPKVSGIRAKSTKSRPGAKAGHRDGQGDELRMETPAAERFDGGTSARS